MNGFKNLNVKARFIPLLQFSALGLLGFNYFHQTSPHWHLYDEPLVYLFYGLNIAVTIGFFGYILWFYTAYKNVYNTSQSTNFFPSFATILCHIPLLSCVSMPITLNEVWNRSSSHAKRPLSITLFIYWWSISTAMIFSCLIFSQHLLIDIQSVKLFWSLTIFINILWLHRIANHINSAQNSSQFQSQFTKPASPTP